MAQAPGSSSCAGAIRLSLIRNIPELSLICNYSSSMPFEAEDLVDSSEVAEMLGLNSARSVSIYRSRYDDFPEPVIVKGSGKCVLWMRADIVFWQGGRRRSSGD